MPNLDLATARRISVDSINVLEEILSHPRNNPVKEFDRYEDIESWLREQWAGLFKDLLQRTSSQRQLTSLQSQVNNLSAIGTTLQRYLEEVVQKVSPKQAATLINREQKKLQEARLLSELSENRFVDWLHKRMKVPIDTITKLLIEANTFDDLARSITSLPGLEIPGQVSTTILGNPLAQQDANKARAILSLSPLPFTQQAIRRHSTRQVGHGAASTLQKRKKKLDSVTNDQEK